MKSFLPEQTPPPKLLKATEVAQILNVSRAFAYRLMQSGEIRTVNIRSSRRVSPGDLDEFIQQNKATTGVSFGLK